MAVEERKIMCGICNRSHILVLESNYDVIVFDLASIPPKALNSMKETKTVQFTIIYTCPNEGKDAEVVLEFPSTAFKRFRTATLKEVK